ncbi:DNA-binding protein [Allostella sp. ATCC 35155]|nr:DNA-binding protein [Stella sp. ATCC 35155]
MPFTQARFGAKIRELREHRQLTITSVAQDIGIAPARLTDLEAGLGMPTGDEVLYLAGRFRCDFAWLIEDGSNNPDDGLEVLFRNEDGTLTSSDRDAIAEFVHLCKAQELLDAVLRRKANAKPSFRFIPSGGHYIAQGIACARSYRRHLGLGDDEIVTNPFDTLRADGLRVFRRAMPADSTIAGLYLMHPTAGSCLLVNYRQDLYRQRFSVMHEAGHAFMDHARPYNISKHGDLESRQLSELRANTFASTFLMPDELLRKLGSKSRWDDTDHVLKTADRLWVTVPALLSALKRSKIIDDETRNRLRAAQLRLPEKRESELVGDYSPSELERKSRLMARGLHINFVLDCMEALTRGDLSIGRVSELLLVLPEDVYEIASLFRVTIRQ